MDLIFKLLYFFYSFKAFLSHKIFIRNINPNDLVLDVGSGDKPFWRADVIVDKFLKDDQQRHSGSILYDRRKIFIQADVEKLPFKDKVFDFVFCSHLLEHVTNPDKAILELTRVAKRGYIEVPYAILDLFQPFPPHLWFCEYKNDTLIFVQREKENNFFRQATERFGNIFYNKPLFQFLLSCNDQSTFISLYWADEVKFKVIRTKYPYQYKYQRQKNTRKPFIIRLTFFIYAGIYRILSLLFYKKRKIDIQTILKA